MKVSNNAFENGRSQASLRSLTRAVQRGRSVAQVTEGDLQRLLSTRSGQA